MTWTKVEEEVVKKYYQNNTKIYIHELQKLLPGKSAHSIKKKAQRLGVVKRWKRDEELYLKQNINTMSLDEIAHKFNKTRDAVFTKARRLGILDVQRESVTNLAGEEWRKIKGFNYSISNYGKVKNNTGKMYIVKSNDNGRGYKQVNLHKNKKRHTFYVHRLVAEYFIPNPDNKEEVNHIDGNKRNNYFKNLEWVTRQENIKHARETGLITTNGNEKRVLQINKHSNETIKIYNSVVEAQNETGISRSSIYNCCKGISKTAGGYRWKYLKGGNTRNRKREL